MLNGIAPVLVFQFYTKLGATIASATKIPLPSRTSKERALTALVPFYLDENFTGVLIDSESKVLDVDTISEATQDDDEEDVETFQKPLSNRITVEMVASQESLVVTAILAFFEQVYRLVSKAEYSITYLSRGVTLFDGVIQEFVVDQNANENRYHIKMTLEKGKRGPTARIRADVSVPPAANTITLDGVPAPGA